MDLKITYDANSESGIRFVVEQISGPATKHFASQAYGEGLNGIAIVLMCRHPNLNFKPRIRFSKREKTLYIDLMLDLQEMIHLNHQARKRVIIDRLANEVPTILHRYSIPKFEKMRFVDDFTKWLGQAEIQQER